MEQIGAVLREQGVLAKICTEATRCENHWPKFLVLCAALRILAADYSAAVAKQLVHAGLGDDACTVCLLRNLLEHLDQCICDSHTREALLTTMCTWLRVAAE